MVQRAATFNGKPCRVCGRTERYASCAQCVACAAVKRASRRDAMREYARRHRETHGIPKRPRTDEVRAQENARYRKRAALQVARKAAEAAANAERIAKEKAEREEAKRVRKRDYMRRWRTDNPDIQATQSRIKKARRRGAPGKHTAADVQAIGERQRWRCAWCAKPCRDSYHVDHIVPLARGGTNWPDNLCIACPPCNTRKKAKLPHEWAAANGRLI